MEAGVMAEPHNESAEIERLRADVAFLTEYAEWVADEDCWCETMAGGICLTHNWLGPEPCLEKRYHAWRRAAVVETPQATGGES